MKQKNRVVLLFLLPAIIFLWIVGWSLYWIAHQPSPKWPQVMGDACMERFRVESKKRESRTKKKIDYRNTLYLTQAYKGSVINSVEAKNSGVKQE
jgi:hypothetical protein